MRLLIALTLLLLSGQRINAQDSSIKAVSFTAKDRIILRWAPSDYPTWKEGLSKGFKVERFLFTKGMYGVDTTKLRAEKTWMVTPIPLDKLRTLAATDDDYASLEAIFEGEGKEGVSRIERINMQESEYAMALLLADFSNKIAKAQGLTFTDSLIPANSLVGYKITLNGSSTKPAYLLLNPSEKSDLPKIPFSVISENSNVVLKWNTKQLSRHYTGYYIERSGTRNSFTRLNQLPLVKVEMPANGEDNTLIYNDTLVTPGETYFYRLVGLSPFGIEAAKSDTVIAITENSQLYRVALNGGIPVVSSVSLSWACPDSVAARVTSWELKKATSYTGKYSIVGKPNNAGTRSVTDKLFLETSYYKLEGYAAQKLVANSLIVRVEQVDSIPPAAPMGLAGVVSKKGAAQFSWNKPEEGVKAYNIYRSYSEQDTPTTISTTADTTFSEQLQSGLATKVFYYVQAVDVRFNKSVLSKALMLVIPDSIPPVPAIIRKAAKAEGGILLTLISSPSNDIDRYELRWQNDSLPAIQLFKRELPKTYMLTAATLASSNSNASVVLTTYDQSGNVSVSQPFSIDAFTDPLHGKRLAKVEVKRDRKVYHVTITDILATTRELKVYTAVDDNRYALTKSFMVEGTAPITFTITDADKTKSYKIMVVGALNVEPVKIEVR
jgi:hypothetical protein